MSVEIGVRSATLYVSTLPRSYLWIILDILLLTYRLHWDNFIVLPKLSFWDICIGQNNIFLNGKWNLTKFEYSWIRIEYFYINQSITSASFFMKLIGSVLWILYIFGYIPNVAPALVGKGTATWRQRVQLNLFCRKIMLCK